MKSHLASKLLKLVGIGLVGGALILGVTYLAVAPKVTKIGDGVNVIQFLNGGSKSWLIQPQGEEDRDTGPTITKLSEETPQSLKSDQLRG